MKIGNWLSKNGSTILTCLGAGGVVATVMLAIKATPKAMDKIQTARIDKAVDIQDGRIINRIDRSKSGWQQLPELTVLETVQVCWKEYVPTVAVGAGSLVCIFGANALSRRQQASMAAAYTALAGAFETYQSKVKTICGPEADKIVQKAIQEEKKDISLGNPPWDEIQTFYIEGYGKPIFFERTMEQVYAAEYNLNRSFVLRGYISLNEFMEMLGLPPVEGGDEIGWEECAGEAFYGYKWIDFCHRYIEMDELTVCSIEFPFPPHDLNEYEKEMDEMLSGKYERESSAKNANA
jgi:hypothetical protein